MDDATKFTVIRYEGQDYYGGLKQKQTFNDIGPNNPVEQGDICLWRGSGGDTFPHVSMVYDSEVTSGTFRTIDGNQTGVFDPFHEIGVAPRKLSVAESIYVQLGFGKFFCLGAFGRFEINDSDFIGIAPSNEVYPTRNRYAVF